jgi:hypothetical protein
MPSIRSARGAASLLALVLVACGFIGVTGVAVAPSAGAVCARQPLEGEWKNINSATRSMTRVTVGFGCGDVRLCDVDGSCTTGQTGYTLRPFGRCSPSDCDWGVRNATAMADGWYRAVYAFGFKTSYVWVKTYQFYGLTYLRLYVLNDFAASDGRTDYTTDEWMLR